MVRTLRSLAEPGVQAAFTQVSVTSRQAEDLAGKGKITAELFDHAVRSIVAMNATTESVRATLVVSAAKMAHLNVTYVPDGEIPSLTQSGVEVSWFGDVNTFYSHHKLLYDHS